MTGKNTPQGFIPNIPSVDDILSRVGAYEPPKMANHLPYDNALAGSDAQADLLKSYVQVFSSPAGQRVLEDLLDHTLRRALYSPNGDTIEQVTLKRVFRDGQGSVVCHILKSMHDGQQLGEKKVRRASRAKS